MGLDVESTRLKTFLDHKVDLYNRPEFIALDPISVPHSFAKKQDIEISAFFAATFAWGQRKTIIKKTLELMQLFDGAPHDFIVNHRPRELKRLTHFRHRTFQPTDLLYFVDFLRHHYRQEDSLEKAFKIEAGESDVSQALDRFRKYFFSLKHVPARSMKHIASPSRNSSCKRLNMFLRWMVRSDSRGVDFGLWRAIRPSELICPVDIHAGRMARSLGLLSRIQNDWRAAGELTGRLKVFDPNDPVKYDFALFGMGIVESEL